MEYTIEQFEIEFENAPDSMKNEVLLKALDNLDVTNPDIKNKLLDYKQELKDVHYSLKVDEDIECNSNIDNGKYKLYTCIKEVPGDDFVVGNNYYADVVDIKKYYMEKTFGEPSLLKNEDDKENPELLKYISELKPLIFIVRDNGIGTLKYKRLFLSRYNNLNFYDYFQEYI